MLCIECYKNSAVPGKDLCTPCFTRRQQALGGGGLGRATGSGLPGGGGIGGATSVWGSGGGAGGGGAAGGVDPFAGGAGSSAYGGGYGAPGINYCTTCRRSPSLAGTIYCDVCSQKIVEEYEKRVIPQLKARNEHVCFYERNAPFYEFTNFFPCEITYAGKVYPTSEALFQAAKFFDFAPAVGEQIRRANGARAAFDIAHANHHLERPDWMAVRDFVMLEALRLKYANNVHMRRCLLVTDPLVLVEHTVNDSYWGSGGDFTGTNRLGGLLMQVRNELSKGIIGRSYESQGWPRCTATAPLGPTPPSPVVAGGGVGSPAGFGAPPQQPPQQQQFRVVDGGAFPSASSPAGIPPGGVVGDPFAAQALAPQYQQQPAYRGAPAGGNWQ